MPEFPLSFSYVKSFEAAGVWKNYKDAHGGNRLQKKTLIYGFNGTGKTTLSRVFASVERGEIEERLPDGCAFELMLSDGRILSSTSLEKTFGTNLVVFNTDFVERNFFWDQSRAEPIFYLDEKNIDKKKQFEESQARCMQAEATATNAIKALTTANDQLKKTKTEIARRVRDLAPSQRYSQSFDARKIESAFAKRNYTNTDILIPEDIAKRQSLLNQDAPLARLTEVSDIAFGLSDWWAAQSEVLDASPGSVMAEEFRKHAEMMPWLRTGLRYHGEHDLRSCLFCGSPFTERRKEELSQSFDSAWDSFTTKIATGIADGEHFIAGLRDLYQAMPKTAEVQPSERDAYNLARAQTEDDMKSVGNLLKGVVALLKEKQVNPSQKLPLSGEAAAFSPSEWSNAFSSDYEALNSIIAQHNKAHDEFSAQQERAFGELRDHVLAEEQEGYSQLIQGASDADSANQRAQEALRTAQQERDRLNNEIRTHGIGAEKLNGLLATYLGHRDIRIQAVDDGYQLVRIDGKRADQLSEGEKTAIAFCFFLTQFNAEGRKKKDLVVVIDDPISSLDTAARTHAFSLMNRMTKNCAQTIVLTHNMSFMNMIKREFTKSREANSASLLELRCMAADATQPRTTVLAPMSALLQRYDTEYHYLFELVRKATKDETPDYQYLLPNAIRKLLEMFLSFAEPGETSFTGAIMSSGVTIPDHELKALERLVQIESHGTMDGFSSLPSLTIEESLRAAKAAIAFIKARDRRHHDSMCRVCESVN